MSTKYTVLAKTVRQTLPLLLIGTVLTLQGCMTSGVSGRAEEKAAVFNNLPPAVQERIKAGFIGVGYTEDMVYIALGKPSKTETRTSDSGDVQVWIYKNMPYRGNEGFDGLRYNTDKAITPGATGGGRPQAKYGTQTDNNINQDAMDSSIELPDMPMGTYYVFFFMGKVFKTSMDPN